MSKLLIFFFLLLSLTYKASSQKGISTMDFVKVKDHTLKEAIFFYENNWKVFRDIALQKGFIESYRLVTALPDSSSDFDLILITDYKDSSQFKLSEERFQQIIRESRPDGPKLLHGFTPKDFKQTIFSRKTMTLFKAKE